MAKTERTSVADKLAALQKKQGIKIGSASHAVEPVTGYTTGNMTIDHLTGVGGIPKGRITEIFGDPSSGKGVSLSTPVLTPDRGFVPMSEISLGDRIVDPINGEESYVIGVYPQPVQQVYRVTLDDGDSVVTDSSHLWGVSYRQMETPGYQKKLGTKCLRCGRSEVRARNLCASCHSYCRTHGMLDEYPKMLSLGRGSRNWEWVEGVKSTEELIYLLSLICTDGVHLPAFGEFDFDEGSLPLDPYLLGFILGDGHVNSGGGVAVTIGNQDSVESLSRIASMIPHGVELRRISDTISYRLTGVTTSRNPIQGVMKDLGLAGKRSWEKFVPEMYKYASHAARLAVLQGLMDTDGNWAKSDAEFSSASEQLRDDVAWLARSLGLKVRVGEKQTSYTYKGERRQGRTAYRVSIVERDDVRVFRLSRKLKSVRTELRTHRRIVSIEPEGFEATQCIRVSAKSEMFVVGDFIPTHNSSLAIQAAANEQRRMLQNNEEGYILYLDHEHALDVEYMQALGLDTEHSSFITAQPNFLEDGAEIVRDLLGEIPLKMIIWDSIGQMVPRARQEGDFDQRTSAMNRARLLTGMLQMITGHLAQNKVSGIFINHVYTTIPTGYGQVAKDTTPGGKGIDFYSSLRLKTTAVKKIKMEVYDEIEGKDVDRVQAVETLITVVKNKVAPNAYRTSTVRLQLGRGFDNMWSALQILKNNGHIVASGAWNYFNPQGKENLGHPNMPISASGRPALQGEKAVLDFADEHPEWRDRLIKIAESVLASNPDQLASGTAETLDPYEGTFEVDNR